MRSIGGSGGSAGRADGGGVAFGASGVGSRARVLVAAADDAPDGGKGRDGDDGDSEDARNLEVEAVGLHHRIDAEKAVVHVVGDNGSPRHRSAGRLCRGGFPRWSVPSLGCRSVPADSRRGERPTPQREREGPTSFFLASEGGGRWPPAGRGTPPWWPPRDPVRRGYIQGRYVL